MDVFNFCVHLLNSTNALDIGISSLYYGLERVVLEATIVQYEQCHFRSKQTRFKNNVI